MAELRKVSMGALHEAEGRVRPKLSHSRVRDVNTYLMSLVHMPG
jgi:hypothetical protein